MENTDLTKYLVDSMKYIFDFCTKILFKTEVVVGRSLGKGGGGGFSMNPR